MRCAALHSEEAKQWETNFYSIRGDVLAYWANEEDSQKEEKKQKVEENEKRRKTELELSVFVVVVALVLVVVGCLSLSLSCLLSFVHLLLLPL